MVPKEIEKRVKINGCVVFVRKELAITEFCAQNV